VLFLRPGGSTDPMPGVVNPWTTDIHNSSHEQLAAKPPIARAKVVSYPIRWLAPPAEDVSASGLKDRGLMSYEKPLLWWSIDRFIFFGDQHAHRNRVCSTAFDRVNLWQRKIRSK
jgi:hypothetical protein